MQHIYVNFKRFDIEPEFGGVNRICSISDFGATVAEKTKVYTNRYSKDEVEFCQFYPEAQIPGALCNISEDDNLEIGCQGVFRRNVAKGGNFGAFTTSLPAAAAKTLGCAAALIGHCEERNDKNELLTLGGNKDITLVNRILNEEVKRAIESGMKVLYCIGEKDTEVDKWDEVLAAQVKLGLEGVDTSKVVIAYEPVWSIGPGKTPAGKDYITKVARLIKSIVDVPVVYGGGLKEANAEMLASIEEIDGGLIALTRFSGEIGFYPEEYGKIIELYMNGKRSNKK
jgi:Triosephosphate isomerase